VYRIFRWGKRIVIGIVGGAVLFAGLLMIVLPGPAVVVIPIGLGILSLEFERPRIWLIQMRRRAARMIVKLRQRWRQRFGGARRKRRLSGR
jgi:tellurite resistance protein TerC